MKINKLLLTLIIGAAVLTTGCERVAPGYVGIKVNKLGSDKGVAAQPLDVGYQLYNPLVAEIYQYPTFVQNAVWDKDLSKGSPGDDSVTFNSIEGAIINADIALAYSFDGVKVPSLFQEFRASPEVLTHGFMKNEINNAFNRVASKMRATDIFGERKQVLLDEVRSDLNKTLGVKGFKFDLISFHGALRVDNSVQARINAVLEASQRALEAETKVQQSKAEADQAIEKARGEKESAIAKAEGEARSITLKAEAQAKANELVSKSLTVNLIAWEATQRWNGNPPQVLGQSLPLFNLSTNK